ncbi:type II toxin-antitoxin system RelE/ParE family toxin [Aquimarina litoralis]|uniref:type II toxin-antitoxin system RelE/ParE family toxin n=1 Tax=Aquimarina litoralis TaxID=584605 RepID=UPI001C5825B8|nr:type II toxin-antitoxin system RelE/ParE family toxin [Aquimarina litoralis]MBW1298515.1 type II toxin-antitoxin system RelE/ParE family toxin [Aquimarina litoralis]
MARRIVWTSKADIIFTEILEFYCNRNKSKTYSRKLNREVNTIVQLLPKYPFIGIKTEIDSIRVLIKGNYKVFYENKPSEIIILLVWDTRQDPTKIPLE